MGLHLLEPWKPLRGRRNGFPKKKGARRGCRRGVGYGRALMEGIPWRDKRVG
jgi:hypothetical protein